MTEDAFESEVRRFVDSQNGGDFTTKTIYQMLKAVDADGNTRHAESLRRFGQLEERLEQTRKAFYAHVDWTNEAAMPRLAALEAEAKDLARVRDEHRQTHEMHLATDHTPLPFERSDKPDKPEVPYVAEREGEEMRVSFRIGKWILITAGVVVISVSLNWLLLARGQTRQLAAIKASNSDLTSLVTQQHQDTTDLLQLLRAEHPSPESTP